MNMQMRLPVVVVPCVLVALAVPAKADETRGQTAPKGTAEITPYVSLAPSASSGVGAAVRWPLAENLSVEFETGYRQGEVHALSSNVSLIYDLPAIGRVTPYLAGGIGLDQYGVAIDSGGNDFATMRKTALAVNAGGGIRVPVYRNWGVRTDARWFNGIGSAPERWRVYNGVTFGGGGH